MAIKNVSIKEQQSVVIKVKHTDGSVKTVTIYNMEPYEDGRITRLVEEINNTDRWSIKSFNYEVLNATRIVNTSVAAMKRMMDDNPDAIWETEFEEALLSSIEFDQNIVITPQDIFNQLVETHYENDQDYLSGLAAEAILDDGQMSPEQIDHMPNVVGYQFLNNMNQLVYDLIFDGLRIQDDTELRAVSVTKVGRVIMAVLFDLCSVIEIY